jgi:hypothetical protein
MFLRNVVDFQRTIGRYIPEDSTLHNHRCENLKSCMFIICSGKLTVAQGSQHTMREDMKGSGRDLF